MMYSSLHHLLLSLKNERRQQTNYVFDYPEPITNLQLLKDGYKLKEVAVNMRERQFGQSSIRLFKSVYYMLNVGLMLFIFGIGNGGRK